MKQIIKIMDLEAGMCLANDFYEAGQLKIEKGVPLTKEQVEIIQKDWHRRVTRYQEHEEIANGRKHIKETKEFQDFSEDYRKSIATAKVVFNSVLEDDTQVDTEAMCKLVDVMLENCGATFGNIVIMLNNIEGYDNSTYAHCVNVSLLATMIGRKLDFSEDEQRILAVGGLLHDVGKLKVPAEIIKKAGKLNDDEYDVVKHHPEEGYKLLKAKGLEEDILMCVLQHHEKCDGTGYPQGLNRDTMNKYAKVIAIADVYDALTSQRVYRDALCPFIAAEIFEEESYEKYEVEYLLPFLHYIVEVYVGMEVVLSNGEKGRVVMINQDNLSKPLLKTSAGFVDLAKSDGITIEEIIQIEK